MNNILVTGATGVVGSELLRLLLLNSKNKIILLMRGKKPEERLQSVFSFLELDYNEYKNRIEIINSSIESENFNLTKSTFEVLAKSLGQIYNCAANVNLTQDYRIAKLEADQSFKNLEQLLLINRNIKLDHVSTVGVKGKRKAGLTEDKIDLNHDFFNSYEAVKAYLEVQTYKLMSEGYLITIHRPSMVVGNSVSGKIIHFQIFYFLLRLISGELTFGFIPPILNLKLDTVSSDFVAKLIVQSSLDKNSIGKIIHQCSGPEISLSLGEILEIYNNISVQLNKPRRKPVVLPKIVFYCISHLIKRFPLSSKWKTRIELFPQLLDYASQEQVFLNDTTKRTYQHLKWMHPNDYLPQTMQFYLKQKSKKTSDGDL